MKVSLLPFLTTPLQLRFNSHINVISANQKFSVMKKLNFEADRHNLISEPSKDLLTPGIQESNAVMKMKDLQFLGIPTRREAG